MPIAARPARRARWFSPSMFGKQWMEWEGHTGTTMGGSRPLGLLIGLTGVGALVSAYTLSWLCIQTGTGSLGGFGTITGSLAPKLLEEYGL